MRNPVEEEEETAKQDPEGRPSPEEMRKLAETMLNNLMYAQTTSLSSSLDKAYVKLSVQYRSRRIIDSFRPPERSFTSYRSSQRRPQHDPITTRNPSYRLNFDSPSPILHRPVPEPSSRFTPRLIPLFTQTKRKLLLLRIRRSHPTRIQLRRTLVTLFHSSRTNESFNRSMACHFIITFSIPFS